jgi:anti-anti-sigma factor
MENFQVAREDRSDVTILRLRGFLDAHTAPQFEHAIQELITEKRYNIIISMAELNYISSAGLGVFMGFIEEIREKKGDIKLLIYSVSQPFTKYSRKKMKRRKNIMQSKCNSSSNSTHTISRWEKYAS